MEASSHTGFTFQRAETKATKLTKDEIIQELQSFARESRSRSFGLREFDAWRKKRISAGAIGKIFGTWAKAMQEADLKPTKVHKKDHADLVETFKACWIEQRSEPTGKQFEAYLKRTNSPYTLKTYIHWFGSLGRLAQRIVDHQEKRISSEQLHEKHSPKKNRKPLPLDLRYAVLLRDKHQCVLCGASPLKDKSVTLEVDHIMPVARGGSNDPSNLRALCMSCNQGKNDSVEELGKSALLPHRKSTRKRRRN